MPEVIQIPHVKCGNVILSSGSKTTAEDHPFFPASFIDSNPVFASLAARFLR